MATNSTRYCTHGYERCVRGTDGILRHDAAADAYTASDRKPILAYSRTAGNMLELVPSASEPGKFHLVDPINRQCDCKGWEYRRTCRHLSPLAPARPLTLCPSCETGTLDQNDPHHANGRDVCRACAMGPLPRTVRIPVFG